MKILLTQNKYALIDKADYNLIEDYKWYFTNNGYAAAKLYFGRENGKNVQKGILMHRIIMKAKKGQDVDHSNKNKLDNRRSNLRLCTRTLNLANKFDLNKNKSGYKGVSFFKWGTRKKRWVSQIQFKKKALRIGYFYTPEEAALAYNQAAKEHFGEFAYLNQIGGSI